MKRIEQIINILAEIERREPAYIVSSSADKSAWYRSIVCWISCRVYDIPPIHVASVFGYASTRNIVSYSLRRIDREITNKNLKTLDLINLTLCKHGNMTQEKTDGTCSPSDLFDTLSKYLPSEQISISQTHGKSSQTDTADTRLHSSDILKLTKEVKSSTRKVTCRTSHTSHGTRSRSYISEDEILWAKRQAIENKQLVTLEEKQMYAGVIIQAIKWGNVIKEENTIQMMHLQEQINNRTYDI